jgi:carbon-monoxide dehydrogenase large subunit
MATASAGQGHQTVVAQLLADELGITPGDVTVDYLDSSQATEFGAAASRMGIMLSGAATGLGRALAGRLCELAADEWGCDREEVSFRAGGVERPATGDRLEVADLAGEETAVVYEYHNPATVHEEFDEALAGKFPTYPATAYSADAPVVEVDAETGEVEVLKYYSLHDCGTVMHPDIVEGQVQGAIAHGIGAALLEEFGYDESGQPQAVTMFDYRLPSIENVPEMELEHRETPSPFTERGVKGAGEGGTIAASATIPSSVNAALEPLGVTVDEVPVTPDRVRRALRERESTDD